MWKSKFYGAFVLNRRVVLHAIDETPARWRGGVGSSPLDGARTAASSRRNDLVKDYRVCAPDSLVDFYTGHSVRSLGPRVSALSPSELMDPIGDCGVLRGGLCDGSKTRRTLARSLGANTFADLRIDCAASAFRLDRLRLERLDSGDCAAAVVASCAVPGLFAPQRLPSGLYADFAVLLDPCGEFALPSLPPSGRLLSLVAGDWNPRCWAEASPSRLPGRLGGDAVVVSLRVSGVSRVWPWAIRRLGARAHREAYLAVSAALDRPLGAGREPRHHRVEAVPPS